MRWNNIALTIAIILLITSITMIILRGFNWGLDFTGGMIFELTLDKTMDINQIRDTLKQAGFKETLVQNLGSNHDIIVRIPPAYNNLDQELGGKILNVINKATSQTASVKRAEFIGPSVGSDLPKYGSIALLVSLIAVMLYVSLRFEWRLAVGAVIALAHDVIITLGVLSLLQIEIDITIIASLMSVIGYSLNDSIVVSDRIRENFNKINSGSTYDVFNVSLTQTLSRTIITSTTVLVVVLILLIFGGSMLRCFSMTLLIGICIGTISSIYIASALALKLGTTRQSLLQKKVEKEGADQKILLP